MSGIRFSLACCAPPSPSPYCLRRPVAEVSGISCASANPARVIVAVTDANSTARKAHLRRFGYTAL